MTATPGWARDLVEDDVLHPRQGDAYATVDDPALVVVDDRVVWANRSCATVLGIVGPDAVAATVLGLLPDDDRADVLALLGDVAAGRRRGGIVQAPTRTLDGWRIYRWRIVDRREDPGVGGVAVFGHDVTAGPVAPLGEAAELAVWWHELHGADEPMIAVDEHHGLVTANAAAEELFRPLDPDTAWRTIRHPDLLLQAFVDVNVMRPGRAMVRVRPLLTRVQLADGRPGSLIWLRDVTSDAGRRRRFDRSAHRWSHVLESLPDPVFLVQRTGEVEFVNDAGADLVARILGLRHGDEEVLHLDSLLDAFDGPTGSTIRQLLADTMEDGEARGPVAVEVRHAPVPMSMLVRTVALAVGEEVLAVLAARDVTAERESARIVERLNSELRAAVAASEMARVEERERVARAIHDDTLQRLTVLRWLLSDAVGKGLDPATVTELDELIVALRDVMTSLHSPVADLGLHAALRQLAQQTATPVHLRCDATVAAAPRHVAELAFRSVREALRNIDAHAQARAATVEVAVVGDVLRVSVRDDGRGVSPEAVAAAARTGHLGIVSVRESVLVEGGTFEFGPNPDGAGTTLRFTIPY